MRTQLSHITFFCLGGFSSCLSRDL